jgi:gas vesicle protein
MIVKSRQILFSFIIGSFIVGAAPLFAQTDSSAKKQEDTSAKKNGLLNQMIQNLFTDTTDQRDRDLQRNDFKFQRYENRIIRNIVFEPLEFGVSIADTSKKVQNVLTRLSEKLHKFSRTKTIENNLFFKKNDVVSPFLLGNNERYLRDLPYLQDARILIRPVRGSKDSVDVIVRTKDIFSIGGSVEFHNSRSLTLGVKDDNIAGWGDRLQINSLYDRGRDHPFGLGMEYLKRNIAGSFIDANVGYLNFNRTFNYGDREEKTIFARVFKPLVNPYMLWTFGLSAETHRTENLFSSDSIYRNDVQYNYNLLDGWAGWNLSSKNIGSANEFERLRYFLSGRVFKRNFTVKPDQFDTLYNFRYSDLFAALGTFSIFKLNYYRTQFIYGFGRAEDIPQGLEASITTGFTRQEKRQRPYTAINFQRYYLSKNEAFFSYNVSAGLYMQDKKPEDVTVVSGFEFFSKLHQLSTRWRQRLFVNASISRQFNTLLQEPLVMESRRYGLHDFKNDNISGNIRLSAKAESVFFSPWSLFYFKFAPFVFGSATLFKPTDPNPQETELFTAIGGGMRTRNEALIFGTIELKGAFFPKKDFLGNSYRISFNTNLRFKYDQNFIKRPEFIQVNE